MSRPICCALDAPLGALCGACAADAEDGALRRCVVCAEWTRAADGDGRCPPCAEQAATDCAEDSATYRSLDRWVTRSQGGAL